MVNIEVRAVPADASAFVLKAAAEVGLSVALDTTQKTYSGSRHWHFKRNSQPGTLEVTWWPARQRLWVSYHENRVGDGWVRSAADELAERVSRLIAEHPPQAESNGSV